METSSLTEQPFAQPCAKKEIQRIAQQKSKHAKEKNARNKISKCNTKEMEPKET